MGQLEDLDVLIRPPRTEQIALRLSKEDLETLRVLAKQRGVAHITLALHCGAVVSSVSPKEYDNTSSTACSHLISMREQDKKVLSSHIPDNAVPFLLPPGGKRSKDAMYCANCGFENWGDEFLCGAQDQEEVDLPMLWPHRPALPLRFVANMALYKQDQLLVLFQHST